LLRLLIIALVVVVVYVHASFVRSLIGAKMT
jgi:hypothetical protein